LRANPLSGAATDAAFSPPGVEKISSCVCSGNQDASWSAWFAARQAFHAPDMSPRAISIQIFTYVGRSTSWPP
jgi:hypothetical protein